MLGLRRKKQNEEDEDIEEGASKKSSSDKPKRIRKKKVEPPKPWGRRERYFVFGVLFLTVGGAFVLALSARSWKLPGLPRLAWPTRVFEQTYVFEGKPSKRDTASIVTAFNEVTKQASGVYGFYVFNLNTDESYGSDMDETFQAASLIKLPLMAAMYSQHEEGNIDLDAKYTLRDVDKVGGSGSIVYQNEGTEFTYRELVFQMGQQSDNTAFRASVNLLGEEFLNSYIAEIGMDNTSFEENTTTPRDIGIFFKKLWERKLVGRSSRDEILKSLTDTIYESYIPKGIPDVRVAHKFGREVHVVNDAGIIFADNPYVLVLMSKGVLEKEADELLPQLAALVHEFETSE